MFGKPDFLERRSCPDERRTQIVDTFTMIKGQHSIKFGGEINHVSDVLDNLFQEGGALQLQQPRRLHQRLRDQYKNGQFFRARFYTSFNQGTGPTAFSVLHR